MASAHAKDMWKTFRYHRDGRLENGMYPPEYYAYPTDPDFFEVTMKDCERIIEEYDWAASIERERQDARRMICEEGLEAGGWVKSQKLEQDEGMTNGVQEAVGKTNMAVTDMVSIGEIEEDIKASPDMRQSSPTPTLALRLKFQANQSDHINKATSAEDIREVADVLSVGPEDRQMDAAPKAYDASEGVTHTPCPAATSACAEEVEKEADDELKHRMGVEEPIEAPASTTEVNRLLGSQFADVAARSEEVGNGAERFSATQSTDEEAISRTPVHDADQQEILDLEHPLSNPSTCADMAEPETSNTPKESPPQQPPVVNPDTFFSLPLSPEVTGDLIKAASSPWIPSPPRARDVQPTPAIDGAETGAPAEDTQLQEHDANNDGGEALKASRLDAEMIEFDSLPQEGHQPSHDDLGDSSIPPKSSIEEQPESISEEPHHVDAVVQTTISSVLTQEDYNGEDIKRSTEHAYQPLASIEEPPQLKDSKTLIKDDARELLHLDDGQDNVLASKDQSSAQPELGGLSRETALTGQDALSQNCGEASTFLAGLREAANTITAPLPNEAVDVNVSPKEAPMDTSRAASSVTPQFIQHDLPPFPYDTVTPAATPDRPSTSNDVLKFEPTGDIVASQKGNDESDLSDAPSPLLEYKEEMLVDISPEPTLPKATNKTAHAAEMKATPPRSGKVTPRKRGKSSATPKKKAGRKAEEEFKPDNSSESEYSPPVRKRQKKGTPKKTAATKGARAVKGKKATAEVIGGATKQEVDKSHLGTQGYEEVKKEEVKTNTAKGSSATSIDSFASTEPQASPPVLDAPFATNTLPLSHQFAALNAETAQHAPAEVASSGERHPFDLGYGKRQTRADTKYDEEKSKIKGQSADISASEDNQQSTAGYGVIGEVEEMLVEAELETKKGSTTANAKAKRTPKVGNSTRKARTSAANSTTTAAASGVDQNKTSLLTPDVFDAGFDASGRNKYGFTNRRPAGPKAQMKTVPKTKTQKEGKNTKKATPKAKGRKSNPSLLESGNGKEIEVVKANMRQTRRVSAQAEIEVQE